LEAWLFFRQEFKGLFFRFNGFFDPFVQVSLPVFEHLTMVFCVAVDNRENYLI